MSSKRGEADPYDTVDGPPEAPPPVNKPLRTLDLVDQIRALLKMPPPERYQVSMVDVADMAPFILEKGREVQLQGKLREYRGRGQDLDSKAKILVLEMLLDEAGGYMVDPARLAQLMPQDAAERDVSVLLNAIGVIKAYNEGKSVYKGSLPAVE